MTNQYPPIYHKGPYFNYVTQKIGKKDPPPPLSRTVTLCIKTCTPLVWRHVFGQIFGHTPYPIFFTYIFFFTIFPFIWKSRSVIHDFLSRIMFICLLWQNTEHGTSFKTRNFFFRKWRHEFGHLPLLPPPFFHRHAASRIRQTTPPPPLRDVIKVWPLIKIETHLFGFYSVFPFSVHHFSL